MAGRLGQARNMLLLLAGAWFFSACSSAPEEAAYILNRLATYEALGSWDGSMPEELDCGGRRYLFGEGSVDRSSSVAGTTADIRLEAAIDVTGPDVFGAGSNENGNPSFNCKANLQFDFDVETGKATGKGTVVDCSDYKCTLNDIKITCSELKAALPKFGCQ